MALTTETVTVERHKAATRGARAPIAEGAALRKRPIRLADLQVTMMAAWRIPCRNHSFLVNLTWTTTLGVGIRP